MSKQAQDPVECPKCGAPMLYGRLKGPVETIHVESLCSLEDSTLEALICPACGHVELHAAHPEQLCHKDISDEEWNHI